MQITIVLDGGVNHPAVNSHTSDGYVITKSELKIEFTSLIATDKHLILQTKQNGKITLTHNVSEIHYH
jgi:hypothetical protein